MEAREFKALELAAKAAIKQAGAGWLVPSGSASGVYRVNYEATDCTCEDFELRGEPCKHMLAVRMVKARNRGTPLPMAAGDDPPIRPKRPTYKQDWPNYNRAQTTEKDWVQTLLADLCRAIPEPPRKNLRGRPVSLSDGVFAAVFKVYCGFSARRFACDLDDARERGHITRAPHFNSVLNVLDTDAVTPILNDLIARSASPLRAVEDTFAVDSSGFCTTRYTRWLDVKYGVPRAEADWVKAHICTGTRTNIVTAVEILDKHAGDCVQLPKLVETTAKTFTVREVSADKAYTTTDNFDAVDAVGGTLYAPFKKNSTGGVGGLFEKAFHFFSLHRETFLQHYHRRSNVESTFSMVKRKHGEAVRSKTDTAMKNEVLAKFVCHNLCCVVSAIYELGINPRFLGLPKPAGDVGPRDIIKFPGRG